MLFWAKIVNRKKKSRNAKNVKKATAVAPVGVAVVALFVYVRLELAVTLIGK